jgi:uncharacterized protein YdhG (YjbR/CyaY superfamily)
MAIWNEELLDKEENLQRSTSAEVLTETKGKKRELDDAVLYLTASHQSKEFLA